MSNNYSIAQNRIDLYFTCLPYNYGIEEFFNTGKSIKWFSDEYNIPISVIRKDIISILNAYSRYDSRYDTVYLVIEPLDYDMPDDTLSDVCDQIIQGMWDELPLVSNIPINYEEHSLTLTAEEMKALDEEFKFDSKVVDFDIKKNFKYYAAPEDLYNTLELINDAIDKHYQIVFSYISDNHRKKNNKQSIFKQISPIKIIYDNEENLYSILGLENGNYVVYNIDESLIKASLNAYPDYPCEPYDYEALNEKIPHVWKNAFDQKNPTHVKVKFSKDVFDSVRDDLVFRNPEKTLSEISDGYFFFEDDIYGVDAFDAWVRTYGCKAVIIEPKSLAKKRIESLKKTLELYANID